MTDNRNDFGKMLKRQRVMIPLTLHELARATGVSTSHLGRIERGDRFPSANILRKLAKPLGFEEDELFTRAGYLSPQPPTKAGRETYIQGLDPYVARVLASESVEVHRTAIAILSIFKSMAKGSECNIGFAKYVHRNYPEVDEDTITMTEDVINRESAKGK